MSEQENPKPAAPEEDLELFLPENDPLIGSVFAEKYKIETKLGEGMGIVYKATDIFLHRPVVVKMLIHASAFDRKGLLRFRQEGAVLSKLQHPNIVTVYEYGVNDNTPYLAMQFIEGTTVSALIDEKKHIDVKDVVDWLIQAADALDYAHKQHVIHRDLKPGNLIVESDTNSLKVLDFGIAKITADGHADAPKVTTTGAVFGSPPYMSPEQATGQQLDGRSDTYSLGCVAFEMLTGRTPHKGIDPMEFMVRKQVEPVPTLKEVCPDTSFPEDMQKILDRMLAKERSERFGSMSELAEALKRFKDGQPCLVKRVRRRSHKPVLITVSCFIIIGAMVVFGPRALAFAIGAGNVNPAYLTPDLLTRSWKDFDFEGQRALDQGQYQLAREKFEKALFKAKLDPSDQRDSRVGCSLIELSCAYAANDDKVPEWLATDLKSVPNSVQTNWTRMMNDVKTSLASPTPLTEKQWSKTMSILSELTLQHLDDYEGLPDLYQTVSRRLTAEKPAISDTIQVQLNAMEILATRTRNLHAKVSLSKAVADLEQVLQNNEQIRSDWRWCCTLVVLDVMLRNTHNPEMHKTWLEQSLKDCDTASQRLVCRSTITDLLYHCNRGPEATSYLENALREYEREETGAGYPSFVLPYSLYCLGILYLNERHHPTSALHILNRGRSLCGEDIATSAPIRQVIAECYRALGDHAKAQAVLKRIVQDFYNAEGLDQLKRAQAFAALGESYCQNGQLNDGEIALRQAIAIYDKFHSPNISSIRNLAQLCASTGRKEEAQQLMARIDAIRRK